ncbi:ATP-binding cassette domain-containing protein [Saccharopolyspora phatthalungensis]|uniref:ABC-type dipeptide/oligopeptide/nickel transport system ATPase subunit n=1 Tax=Saccharopolyspora phatthalungensis TaxID=664693 RepID=A0A840QDN7_9PSEU|nr:ATP-binding cassette domain-containing protein [Saccharopolyspora phatthalungensis]MBB5158894.1 ABC-type dipeptide/oligopeptide/nickel transport system ATPase subunit [Saccharopolyspora phatthalungensis]
MLESLGLAPPEADRRPHALSGGQLQRAALARALLAHPAVLICDEITSGQDLINQAELLGLLTEAARTTDVGLILISHDLPAIARALVESANGHASTTTSAASQELEH